MERVLRERDHLRPGRLDLLLTVTLILLIGATVLVFADPELDFVLLDRTLDVALNSLVTLASFGMAQLAYARYRESDRLSSLFQASALMLLGVVGLANVVLVLLKADGRVGLTLGLPEQFPVYVVAITWLMSAALFFFSGVTAVLAIHARPHVARRLILLPPVVLGAITLLIYPIGEMLPPLIGPEGIGALVEDPKTASPLPGVEPLLIALVGFAALLLFAAAVLLRFAYAHGEAVTDGFLAIGLVIAAFADLHFILYPGVYTGLVTSGDALRLAFYGVLLLGLDAEARADLRALRAAYAALDRLRVNEAERAALEERTRLAREIHDGLAQHLWFAKLKHERLAPLVPDDARPLSGEVGSALDAAIVEARQALVTMRAGPDTQMPLSELISRTVEDFGHRSGLRVRYVPESLPDRLSVRQQAELLRIVQEALTNIGKHADATVAKVTAAVDGDELVVTIADNGRGFDRSLVRADGLGIRGMKERARLVGGHLTVTSEPSDGTRVELRMPLVETGTTAIEITPPTGFAQTQLAGPNLIPPSTGRSA